MLKLTDEFNDVFKWNGILYHVNLNFDNVLLLFEMFNDNLILRYEKTIICDRDAYRRRNRNK